eukprot:12087963-Alexandrium_andersonii.AAC.1
MARVRVLRGSTLAAGDLSSESRANCSVIVATSACLPGFHPGAHARVGEPDPEGLSPPLVGIGLRALRGRFQGSRFTTATGTRKSAQ